jgi:hypothetical protein
MEARVVSTVLISKSTFHFIPCRGQNEVNPNELVQSTLRYTT